MKRVVTIAVLSLLITTGYSQYKSLEDLPERIKTTKVFKRYQYYHNQRSYPYDTIPVHLYRKVMQDEIRKRMDNDKVTAAGYSWTNLGPAGVENSIVPNWGIVSGRVKSIAIHPTDPLTIYIGASCGGIWKSTDGGDNWMDIGVNLQSLAFGSIAIDPNNPAIVYAGSGEARSFPGYDSFFGQGMFKSVDGGQSWVHILNGFGTDTHFGDIDVSPFDSQIVLAALGSGYAFLNDSLPNEGIWRSSDAGLNWTKTLPVQDAFDLVFHPTNPNIIYAATGGKNPYSGFYKSEDQGITWNKIDAGLPPSNFISRMQIDIARSNPSILYAIIYDGDAPFINDQTRAYKSTDGGDHWFQIAINDELGGNYGNGWRDQGFYDLCIAVDPSNPNHVYFGNIELHVTTNGNDVMPVRPDGNNAYGSIAHVDYHKLIFAPSDPNYLYIGCDGGIYQSTDGGETASQINIGLSTLQFYRVASHPENHDILIGGMQDNACAITFNGGTQWTQVTNWDGMECFFDHTYPDSIVYASAQRGYLRKSTDGGITFFDIKNINGAWITPFFMHPEINNRLYAANRHIFQSMDGGLSWDAIAVSVTDALISDMYQSQVNPDHMILCTGMGEGPGYDTIFTVKVSIDEGGTWEDVTANIPGEKRWISRVKTDPVDPNTFYVLRTGFSDGNKLYRSANLGAAWANISGDLPNLPCNDLFIDPEDTDHIFIATDLGIYHTMDGGATWTNAAENLPLVAVYDFDYIADLPNRYLRAGTYGRSIYETNLLYTGIEHIDNSPAVGEAMLSLYINPNPSLGHTQLTYSILDPLSRGKNIRCELFTVSGIQVRVLIDETKPLGTYKQDVDISDMNPGIYLIRLTDGKEEVIKKIIVQ